MKILAEFHNYILCFVKISNIMLLAVVITKRYAVFTKDNEVLPCVRIVNYTP